MKRYLLAVAVLTGCQPGPEGPPGPQGPQGERGAAADVAPLLAELAALRAEVDALRARPVVRVPHLIVKETGEDLGVYLDADTVFSEKVGAPVQWWATEWLYAQPGCAGPAYASDIKRPAAYGIGPLGDLFTLRAAGGVIATASRRTVDGTCADVPLEAQRIVEPIGATMPVVRGFTGAVVELR